MKAQTKYLTANPRVSVAHRAVRTALKQGRLLRPEHCDKCGQRPGKAKDGRACIHAHHHRGYNRPLDVMWLCPKCHKNEDGGAAGERNGNAKLTVHAIAEIRSTLGKTKALAKKYGVDRTTIQRARRGVNWKAAALQPKGER